MEYPKIQGIFKRYRKDEHPLDTLPKGKKYGDFIDYQFATPTLEFLFENEWVWSEKLDGTNIRIYINATEKTVEIKGRTDRADIPKPLLTWINNWVDENAELLYDTFSDNAVLYGEGVGAKIQKGGGNYGEQHFKLFDVLIDGYWLEKSNVSDIANKFNLQVAHVLFRGTIQEAIDFVKTKPHSVYGEFVMEGVVGQPAIRISDHQGNRIATKIKVCDFT